MRRLNGDVELQVIFYKSNETNKNRFEEWSKQFKGIDPYCTAPFGWIHINLINKTKEEIKSCLYKLNSSQQIPKATMDDLNSYINKYIFLKLNSTSLAELASKVDEITKTFGKSVEKKL